MKCKLQQYQHDIPFQSYSGHSVRSRFTVTQLSTILPSPVSSLSFPKTCVLFCKVGLEEIVLLINVCRGRSVSLQQNFPTCFHDGSLKIFFFHIPRNPYLRKRKQNKVTVGSARRLLDISRDIWNFSL
jgi:hypothetical protein